MKERAETRSIVIEIELLLCHHVLLLYIKDSYPKLSKVTKQDGALR